MNRRVTAAVIAAVLALGAFVSIFIYVRNADVRALNGVEPRSVYIVVNTISKGTLAEDLGTNVVLTQVPAKTVPDNAVAALSEIAKKVASIELVKGEVLLTSRFIDPALQSVDEVPVPKGMQQISLLLKPEQVRGGIVKAGETVGVFVTIKTAGTSVPIKLPGVGVTTIEGDVLTKQILTKVLVTRVQGGVSVTTDANTDPKADPKADTAPADSIMLTLALVTSDIEKLTWAQGSGSLTLSVENKDADDSSSQYTNGSVVLR